MTPNGLETVGSGVDGSYNWYGYRGLGMPSYPSGQTWISP